MVERRPGRPRLYCTHACRQRAYEHRHGFLHQRTITALPGQSAGERWGGTGYERGIIGYATGKVHALRTSVRPDPVRHTFRATLCGALAKPAPMGKHFSPNDPRACASCAAAAGNAVLQLGINPSNELSRLRAIIEETEELRLSPAATMRWLRGAAPPHAA